MRPRVTARVSSEQASRPCREGRFPRLHIIQHRPRSARRRWRSRKRRLSPRSIRRRDHRLETDSINRSGITSPKRHCLTAQEGRAPDQAGSASHSAHRIRRSSSPTLMKTKGASSWPVFEPTNIAGTPHTSLMIALFAISESRLPLNTRPAVASTSEASYWRKTTTAAISSPKNNGTSTGGTSHSRKLKRWVSDM